MDNLGLKVRILFILTSIGLVISITSCSYAYFVGQINDGTVDIVSGYFVQECKVRSDNTYSCNLST